MFVTSSLYNNRSSVAKKKIIVFYIPFMKSDLLSQFCVCALNIYSSKLTQNNQLSLIYKV